ncbi:MAG: DUF3394 domain-containing protein, partial [Pseudolabrys sp.]
WAAVKVGAAGFIVPFMIIYEPALLMIGDWPAIIAAFVTSAFGILMFAGGLHGYFVTATTHWQRAVLIVGGLLLIKPGIETDIVGAILAAVVIAAQVSARRNTAQTAAAPAKPS